MDAYLAEIGNQFLDYVDIDAAFFQQDLSEDNFNFFDSEIRNKEARTWTTGHYISFSIGLYLILSLIIATSIEIYQIVKNSDIETVNGHLNTEENGNSRPS